jgi:hypothetical protein
MRLILSLFILSTCSIRAFATDEPPVKPGRCQALIAKTKTWLQSNRRTMALSSFVMDTINDPSSYRAHYNSAVWNSYLQDPKQAVRHYPGFTYSSEIEALSVMAGRTILDESLASWEKNAKLLFVYPSPISLYTVAKEKLPTNFEPYSLLLIKDGLVQGFIKHPASHDAKYESFRNNS